jgi:putative toxin-antitoxin system antitoxin component (TIGR02293 family)
MTRIIEVLGGSKIVGGSIANELDLARVVRMGLPAIAVRKTADFLGLTNEEIEPIISRRTLDRRSQGEQRLSLEESDRLVRLARIAALALDTFGDHHKALVWMRRPNRALGGETPMALSITNPGARLVENILGRMAHGVFS